MTTRRTDTNDTTILSKVGRRRRQGHDGGKGGWGGRQQARSSGKGVCEEIGGRYRQPGKER